MKSIFLITLVLSITLAYSCVMNSRECPCGPDMVPCNGKCNKYLIFLKYLFI